MLGAQMREKFKNTVVYTDRGLNVVYSPNTMTRVILTVLTLALGISPLEDALLVSLVGPWRRAPPCDHIVATITA